MNKEGLLNLLGPYIRNEVKPEEFGSYATELATKIPDNELTESIDVLGTMFDRSAIPDTNSQVENIPGAHSLRGVLIARQYHLHKPKRN